VAKFVTWLGQQPGQRGQKVTAQTVKRRLAPFRAAMADAYERGLLPSHPCTNVRVPVPAEIEEDDDRVRALSMEQVQALLEATPPQHRLVIRLLVETGLRASEMAGLQFKHLDLGERSMVHVRQAYVRGRMGPPKSKHGRRSIPLSDGLARELRRHRAEREADHDRPERYSQLRPRPFDDELVFCPARRRPLDQADLRHRVLKPACARSGLPPLGLHDLRHTCASLLLHGGRTIVQVQKVLGHHSPAFTLSTYVHLLNNDVGAPLEVDPPLTRGSARGSGSETVEALEEAVAAAAA